MSLIENLNWRYATKSMSGAIVPQEKLDAILAAINLAATSYGLQPYTILVVSNQELKDKMQAAAYGQAQVGSASHILVFAVPEKLTAEAIQDFINNVAATRSMPVEMLDGYKGMMLGTVGALPAEAQQVWAAKQAYIALGTAMIAAAEQKVDACPMEGFLPDQVDEILGLKEKGLKSVVLLPLGFRADTDATANYKKVRKEASDLFQFIS
jgi:nitroreductase / dihydropteridine reductase